MKFIKSKTNMSAENIKRLIRYTSELQKVSMVALSKMEGVQLFQEHLQK
jgi:hypothetical protein